MFVAKLKLTAAYTLALIGVLGTAVGLLAAPGPAITTSSELSRPGPGAGLEPLAPGDAMRHALTVARLLPDSAVRAEAFLKLGRAEARWGETAAARATLCLAVRAAELIPPNGTYTFPHPIVRIAAAQAELGDRDGARRTFRTAAQVIEAEDDRHQAQNWVNLVPKELRAVGRISPETVAGYQRYLGRAPKNPQSVISVLLKLQAASGDAKGALRAVAEGPEFAGPAGAKLRQSALMGILNGMLPGDTALTEALAEAKKAVANQEAPPRGVDHRPQELLVIARAEARLGRYAEAVVSARSVMTTDIAKFNQAKTFTEIARGQAEAGDKAGALASARETIAIVATIQKESYKTYPLYEAGEAITAAGGLAEARRLADTIKPHYRSLLRVKIAEASRLAGDEASAIDDLKQALRAAEEYLAGAATRVFPNLGPQARDRVIVDATVDVARLHSRLGDVPAARRTIVPIKDAKGRDDALINLATARAQEGDLRLARELLDRIDSPQARAKGWVSVVCALPAPKAAKGGPLHAPELPK